MLHSRVRSEAQHRKWKRRRKKNRHTRTHHPILAWTDTANVKSYSRVVTSNLSIRCVHTTHEIQCEPYVIYAHINEWYTSYRQRKRGRESALSTHKTGTYMYRHTTYVKTENNQLAVSLTRALRPSELHTRDREKRRATEREFEVEVILATFYARLCLWRASCIYAYVWIFLRV